MPLRPLLPLLLLILAAPPDAGAQYKWREADGRIVYSDMPPPGSIDPGAVLKAPGRPAATDGRPRSAELPKPAEAPAASPAAPVSAADRELEFRKRRIERADAERKSAADSAKAKQAAAACEDTRTDLRALESGMRMSRVNERGEREVVDDAQRAVRLEAARRSARELCPSS